MPRVARSPADWEAPATRPGWKKVGGEWCGGCPITGQGDDRCHVKPGMIICRDEACGGRPSGGLTKEQYGEHGRALGIFQSNRWDGGGPVDTWTFVTADGRTREQYRWDAGNKTWERTGPNPEVSSTNDPPPAALLYIPRALESMDPGRRVLATEGASDCDAAIAAGLQAFARPAARPSPESLARLPKHLHYAVVPDHDTAGYDQAADWQGRMLAAGLDACIVDTAALHPDGRPPLKYDLKDYLSARPADCAAALEAAILDPQECERRCVKTAWLANKAGKPVTLLPEPHGIDERNIRILGRGPRGTWTDGKLKQDRADGGHVPTESASLISLDDCPTITEPVKYIWRNRIARGALNLIGGPPDSGKSLIGYGIAAAVANGLALPDSEPIESGNVVVIGSEDEDGFSMSVARLRAAGAGGKGNVYVLEALPIDADIEMNIMSVCREAAALDPVFVLIDSFVSWYDGGSAVEVRRALRLSTGMLRRQGAAVALIAHHRKAAVELGPAHDRVSGESAGLVGGARFVLDVQKNGDGGIVSCTKHNAAPQADDVRFRIVTAPNSIVGIVEWEGVEQHVPARAAGPGIDDEAVCRAVAAAAETPSANAVMVQLGIKSEPQRIALKASLARLKAAGRLSTVKRKINGRDRDTYQIPPSNRQQPSATVGNRQTVAPEQPSAAAADLYAAADGCSGGGGENQAAPSEQTVAPARPLDARQEAPALPIGQPAGDFDPGGAFDQGAGGGTAGPESYGADPDMPPETLRRDILERIEKMEKYGVAHDEIARRMNARLESEHVTGWKAHVWFDGRTGRPHVQIDRYPQLSDLMVEFGADPTEQTAAKLAEYVYDAGVQCGTLPDGWTVETLTGRILASVQQHQPGVQ